MLPGLREVYDAYARAADELPGLPGALHAELWVSAQLGALEAAAPSTAARRAALADLVQTLYAAATPGARAFLLAMAQIGPVVARRAAGKAAAALPAVPAPDWAGRFGRVTPVQTLLIQDGGLDGERLVCEYRYTAGTGTGADTTGPVTGADAVPHALVVRLAAGRPTEIVIVGDVAGMMAGARQAVQAELAVVHPLAARTAADRLASALTPESTADLPADGRTALVLARHRVELLR